MTIVDYTAGADLPDPGITWLSDGAVIDFSGDWDFTLKIGFPSGAAEHTKTSGITGASTAPNVTISWAAGELDNLDAGMWPCQLTARNSANKDRIRSFLLRINPAVT